MTVVETDQLDIIAVGAHPDDVEIGCGGTLAALADSGLKVGIVDLTDGEPTPGCSDPAIRLAEADSAAEVLGVTKRIVLNLPNRKLFDSFEARVALATEFRRYRPKVIFGLEGKTPMASPDHWQAAQITDAAVFYSRLSKWDDHFDGLPVHPIQRHVNYSLMFASDYSGKGSCQFVYDISDVLERKIEAIRCYATQFPPEKKHVFDRVRTLAATCGLAAGFSAGEVLTHTKPLGSRDLLQTLLLD